MAEEALVKEPFDTGDEGAGKDNQLLEEGEDAHMVGFKQEFNISEFFALASRVFDNGDAQAMASMKNLQDAWRLQFGDEVSPSPQALLADPSRVVALKPTSAHVLTPFCLPQPEIRRARCVLSRDSAVTFDIPSASCSSLSASHSPAGIPPFSPENLSPSSAEYPFGASLSIAPPPGVFPLIFRLTVRLPRYSNFLFFSPRLWRPDLLLCRH
ncbi:hypothetical protein Salat_2760700 [Sesamum alatum]|uniref:Uncharacterized protein n=1 Tax=Sesamum alatum TaxID=300844 RepID=A0AAE2C932_9LAMI|nr:hypothetical protein Salat_2760700 [Sesamum alatum]